MADALGASKAGRLGANRRVLIASPASSFVPDMKKPATEPANSEFVAEGGLPARCARPFVGAPKARRLGANRRVLISSPASRFIPDMKKPAT